MSTLEHTVLRSLQCPVCLNLLSDPRQLSCTHTFCQKCLRGMLACSSQSNANSLVCPICRKATYVKGGNVLNLNTNVPVKSLLSDVRNIKQLCEMCDTEARAVHFCCECGKNMCKACLENHSKWPPHLKHKVVSIEDVREGKVVVKKKVYCQEHVHKSDGLVTEVCTDVCTTCKKLICTRCRMLYHKKENYHIVQDAGEYNASVKKGTESLQAQGKKKITMVKNHMTCVDNQLKRVTHHIDGEKAKINRTCEKAINQIKERKAIMNKQLDDQKEKLCQSLKNMKVADERLVTSIESASVLTGNSLKAPLEGDIVAIRDSLSDELKNVLDRNDPQKKLAIDVADRSEQLAFTQNKHCDQLSMGEVRFVKCNLKCNVILSKKDDMDSMAATPDGRMAVGCYYGGIEIFSKDGKLQQTVIKDARIRGLGFLSDGRYVVRNINNGISLYTAKYEKLDVTFKTICDDVGGHGNVTIDSNDLIYVSYKTVKKIQVFSPAGGKAIREISCNGYEPTQITNCNLLIVKVGSSQILISDKKGDIKHKLCKPTDNWLYATATKGNSVLVATLKNGKGLVSIDEYTKKLMHVKTLISDCQIEMPEKRNWYYLQEFPAGEIALCTTDRLYIFDLSITIVDP